MSTPASTIDGYAVAHTRNVLAAIRAYEALADRPGKAVEAAIGHFYSLTEKRVTPRTIARWLQVVRKYGGTDKVPENEFGARKARPHAPRPVRDRLREIERLAGHLAEMLPTGFPTDEVSDLPKVSRRMEEMCSRVLGKPRIGELVAIKALARRLGGVSIHRVYRFISASEIESITVDLILHLNSLAGQVARKGRSS